MEKKESTLGEIRRGYEIGYHDSNLRIRNRCLDCGKERWTILRKGKPQHIRCRECSRKFQRGTTSSQWKGGRHVTSEGYVEITIQPDDPFYCMSNNGTIAEHRYIMAKHLGRPLTSDEVVDHRGLKYLETSKENRGDNRLENLRLTTSADNSAQVFPRLLAKIKELEKENNILRGYANAY